MVAKKSESSQYSIGEYFLEITYSVFAGFITFLSLFKFLVFPIIFTALYSCATVKTPVPMPVSRLLLFSIIASMSYIRNRYDKSEKTMDQIMKIGTIPYPNFVGEITGEFEKVDRIPLSFLS